jgi:hypothetical protein
MFSPLHQKQSIGMSALGQKQTFAVQKGMSALPPKADIHGPECPLRPKADIRLLNYFVGAGE